ncbi:MAG: Rdx family protein [Polyangiaceae bacterium]|nr:Rdx family protein [Polyangiaceae bacterium]
MSLAAKIQDAFDVPTKLTIGKPGQFDVVVDGKLVFSKQNEGRFPEHQEVLDAMSRVTR